MSTQSITIKPFGTHAILITWPDEISPVVLEDILNFNALLKAQLDSTIWETVPAYNSLTLINHHHKIAFETRSKALYDWYKTSKTTAKAARYRWRLPVCYEGNFGIDLQEVAERLAMETKTLIQLHASQQYTVYGIGFLPGFMYLGGLPKDIEVPRRSSPRLQVAKGAVGIAGKQTGIYPQESPGGWNIIGNCPVDMFNVDRDKPCFVSVGDQIQFYSISKAEYDLRTIEGELGIFKLQKEKIDA